MSTVDGWNTTPQAYEPLSGREVKQDGTVLNVPEWREDLAKRLGTTCANNSSSAASTSVKGRFSGKLVSDIDA